MTVIGRLIGDRALTHGDVYGGRINQRFDHDTTLDVAGSVTRESAMQLSAVWACVSLISDSIANLPLGAFTKRANVRRPARTQPAWIETPNPTQNRGQFVSQQLVSVLFDGNAYVYTIRDRVGTVVEAWNVAPWRVNPRRERGRIKYAVTTDDGDIKTLDQSEMFHIAGMSWPGELRGMSPLEAARKMIGTGIGAQDFAHRYYGQGFSAPGFVEVPGDFTPEQAKDLKDDVTRSWAGNKRAHLPGVLTGGASWKPATFSPEQAQFLETRQYSVSDIARFFRVPPHMIGDVEKSTSWGTGIEEQGIGYVTYTLGPWLGRLEQAYTRWLIQEGGQPNAFAQFNVNALLRGNLAARYEAYAVGRNWGWLSADDILALEDRPPLPEGKGTEYLVPLNMRVAGEPIPEPKAPEAQEPPAPPAVDEPPTEDEETP
jgi:HK97 family phage portal protein